MHKLMLPDRLYLSANVEVRSNGEGAKTAPVKVVANTGDKFEYPGIGPIVFDLSSYYTPKSKVALNWEHGVGSVGYLNHLDISTGSLVASGAIVPEVSDDGERILSEMTQDGVTYEASVESYDFTMEFVPSGESVNVNDRDIRGPVMVVRDWSLDAVAVCVQGKNTGTSFSLAASKAENSKAQKVTFIRASKNTDMGASNMDQKDTQVTVVEASAAGVAPVVETAKVAEVKIEAQAKVETAQVVEAVEAAKTDSEVSADKKDEAAVEPIDPRADIRRNGVARILCREVQRPETSFEPQELRGVAEEVRVRFHQRGGDAFRCGPIR